MKKNRCTVCNKKLKIHEEIKCKCSLFFCTKHRYKDMHDCTYDHKKEWEQKLVKDNPTVIADKLTKI